MSVQVLGKLRVSKALGAGCSPCEQIQTESRADGPSQAVRALGASVGPLPGLLGMLGITWHAPWGGPSGGVGWVSNQTPDPALGGLPLGADNILALSEGGQVGETSDPGAEQSLVWCGPHTGPVSSSTVHHTA